ncbi:uncharacterized protein L3040_003565 [Drepanopeziza brunnea f. sp. 'multigermtubi']|uniref:Uncharacterized protein n=1 Tax=Marssonina brunnea f. sp. multigermtubi (strain MB_m1) TaxID=1072389 RepID=K1XAI3_MARBU|nr:uncharacterized protein MBM_04052 [Drepanopeziza brunnea f. sp. 'multigermtubi' MB_m1]EKD17683.1 hypothetical protein MBM_04052 [Drepanopeziza brunnea f. sp. 'multigermtubi' MB_m1]KAJ5046318.1 hypothetical protein L3040_003565 [Drepanopeziza brunnea f. sp. 'multigermtubi']
MAPKGKSKARAFRTVSSTPKPSAAASLEPLPPFKRAPATLEPFLSHLDISHVYITHIDTKPSDFKKKIFLVPVLMNIAFIGLLIWRIKTIGPFYMKICFSLMGKFNETTIDTANIPFNESVWELTKRFSTFMVDLLLYVFVWPWPRDFFAGKANGNPVAWRFAVRFRTQEIIVRRSRNWVRAIGNATHEGPGQEKLFDILRSAVDPIWMAEKTGYLMLNSEWDLDWRSMIIATKLVDKKTLSVQDFKTTILVHNEDFGWMVIESAVAGGSVAEEEGRRKIVAFKDELTAMGKENLFFRWIELVQFESSRPGGFTPERQLETMAKAKDLFEAQGIDFDKFWSKVGGMEGMPGMDQM